MKYVLVSGGMYICGSPILESLALTSISGVISGVGKGIIGTAPRM